MTDSLLERFAALEDTIDDSSWLDVRRRARRARLRVAAPLAAGAAVVAAAAAFAATGGWVFESHDRLVTAVTHVRLDGKSWNVSVTSGGRLRICLRASQGATATPGCGAKLLALPFGARHVDAGGGQIWAGAAVGFARRISITDARGVVHSTTPLVPPAGTKTPLRYWVIALDGTTARSITAYDAHGRKLTARLR